MLKNNLVQWNISMLLFILDKIDLDLSKFLHWNLIFSFKYPPPPLFLNKSHAMYIYPYMYTYTMHIHKWKLYIYIFTLNWIKLIKLVSCKLVRKHLKYVKC